MSTRDGWGHWYRGGPIDSLVRLRPASWALEAWLDHLADPFWGVKVRPLLAWSAYHGRRILEPLLFPAANERSD